MEALQQASPRRCPSLPRLVVAVAAVMGLPPDALAGTGRGARVAQARAGAAYLWCRVAGQSGPPPATALGLAHQAVSQAATRGERAAIRWQRVWNELR